MLNQVIEGATNLIFKNEKVEEFARKRVAVCLKCPHIQDELGVKICGRCGCFIATKSRAKEATCPINMW